MKKISNKRFLLLNWNFFSLYERNNKKYVVVDELTLKLMKGATIDYENVMIRSGFVVIDCLLENS